MLRLLILETDVTDKLVNIFNAKRTNHVTLVCVFYFTLERKNDPILKKTLRMKRICNKQKRAII